MKPYRAATAALQCHCAMPLLSTSLSRQHDHASALGRQLPEAGWRLRVHNRGFTLIEVMVVIVILGVLAALVVPRIMSKPDEARQTAARYDIGNILQALDTFRLDNQRYPSTEQGLMALVERPTAQPVPNNWKQYLKSAPTDPWGNPYQFLNPGIKSEIDVFSYGADGQPGGEGVNADVGSWMLNR